MTADAPRDELPGIAVRVNYFQSYEASQIGELILRSDQPWAMTEGYPDRGEDFASW